MNTATNAIEKDEQRLTRAAQPAELRLISGGNLVYQFDWRRLIFPPPSPTVPPGPDTLYLYGL
jgi:hypothetical protein